MNAPIKYMPGVFDADLVDQLWEDIAWEKRDDAPRYECWMNDYGDPYTYGSGEHARTYQPLERWEPSADNIRNALNMRGMAQYDCCFINGYINGRQHLGWHADDSPEMDMGHPIAVVSFGAEREIWLRKRMTRTDPHDAFRDWSNIPDEKITLGNGSILIMEAGMQRDWQHRIPKSPLGENCGKRISFTFRKLVR